MPPYPHLFTSIALILLIILHLHHTQKPHHHQQQQQHHPLSPQGKLAFQEKTRLGSTPPSCHNKCNGCHPCMATKVPTTPGRKDKARYDVVDEEPSSSPTTTSTSNSMEYNDPSSYAGRYSNYKPMGWKCRCGNHFYNP